MVSAVPIREFKSCSIISGNISASRARWKTWRPAARRISFLFLCLLFLLYSWFFFCYTFFVYFSFILFFYTFLLCRYPAIISGYLKMISQSFSRCKSGKHGLRLFLHICTAGNRMPGSIAKERFPADRQAIRGSVLVFSRILLILVRFCSYPIFILFLPSTYRANAMTVLHTVQVNTLIGTATKAGG